VILLEKVKEYERSLAQLLKLELHLKEDTMTNKLIQTWDDPTEDLSEEAMKHRANNGPLLYFSLSAIVLRNPDTCVFWVLFLSREKAPKD